MSTTEQLTPNQLSPAPHELEAIARILHDATGIVITQGKSSMVQSRLSKRLRELGLSDYATYIAHVTSESGVEERHAFLSRKPSFRDAEHRRFAAPDRASARRRTYQALVGGLIKWPRGLFDCHDDRRGGSGLRKT